MVLPDAAFFAIAVLQLPQSRNLPFVIPAVIRGRKPRPGVRDAGLRAVRNRRGGAVRVHPRGPGASVRVTAAVAHKSVRHARAGRRHTRKRLSATGRVAGPPVSVRDLDRPRFGVESRHRQSGQVRPRTSAAAGAARRLWVGVGLILRGSGVRFGAGTTRWWARAATCLILLAEILTPRPPRHRPGGSRNPTPNLKVLDVV